MILVGSSTGGDRDDTTDADLTVVYNTDKPFMDSLKELYLSCDIRKAVDILAYTPGQFAKIVNEGLFVQNVMKEGKVIYETS